ncbi:hypothetical protein UYSO10_4995 [Kosakonia radicincitans]|nr:hypothetical protein UYSO10_4995 [Kosakonia radicincitans]
MTRTENRENVTRKTTINASAFTQTAGKAGQTRSKYQGIIA